MEGAKISAAEMQRMVNIIRLNAAPKFVGPDGKEYYIWDKERMCWIKTHERAWELGVDV